MTAFDGSLDDGGSAETVAVTVTVDRVGVRIRRADGGTTFWPLDEVRDRRTDKALELTPAAGPERLRIAGDDFSAALGAARDERDRASRARAARPPERPVRWPSFVFGGVALAAAAAAAAAWFGLPRIADVAAERIPPSSEAELGRLVVQQLAPEGKRCADPARLAGVRAVVERLSAALPAGSPKFEVTVVRESSVNALCAPGGQLVVFEGLLLASKSADELAGVLAHEMQHGIHRHPTRALVRRASFGAAVSILAGDSGSLAALLQGVSVLQTLSYSRADEEEADRDGMSLLLAARFDPAGMVSFFRTLQAQGTELPKGLSYLSTHPRTEERIESLRTSAAAARASPVPVVLAESWEAARFACGTAK